ARRRARDERVTRRGADARAQAVRESRREDARPCRREADRRLCERGKRVADDRDGLVAAEAVREPSGPTLHDVLRRLGDPFDDADDRSWRAEFLREEQRQDRIEHLGRDVGAEARDRKEVDRAGQAAEHARNQRVLDMFKEIASDGFPARAKNVRIKFRGKYYKYPLEALDIAKSMSPFLAARAFFDYSLESLRRKLRPRPLVSAEDWVVQAMGRTLYGLFFGPYTTKVWGIPPSQLAASFAQHR